jgi:hypothetical protein
MGLSERFVIAYQRKIGMRKFTGYIPKRDR